MEIFAVLLIVATAWILIKIFSAGIYLLTIPIKIVLAILSVLLSVFILIPLGIVTGLFAIVLTPFALIIPLLPIILVIAGVVLLVRRS